MDVVVKIEGRDALPVWTIPYVTDWDISPDMLLKRLVYPHYNNEKNEPIFPAAFNLDSSGCPRVIPSEQWADVENRIAMLKDELDAREDIEVPLTEDLFDIWCTRSIDRIIKWAGCRYIWLSEFSEWLKRYNDFDHIIFMKQVKVADDKTEFTVRNIDLNLDPNLISEHELYFRNTELGKIDKESLNDQIIANDGETKIKGDDGVGIKTPTERKSQLYIFIWRVHQFLSQERKPTAQCLWDEIQHRHEDHDTGKIIQEVDSHQILWCSGYGNEQKLQRVSFDKTLSNLRKTPPF